MVKVSPVAIREVKHLQDIVGRRKTLEKIQEIRNPLFRAIATALLEKRVEGNWYQVRGDPEIQGFDFAFLGFKGKPQLETEHLWLRKCRKCGQAIPVLILRRTLHLRDPIPNRIDQYEEKTECLVSYFTIECGEEHFDGFLTVQDLMRGETHGKDTNAQKEAFLDVKSIKKSLFAISYSKIRRIGQ